MDWKVIGGGFIWVVSNSCYSCYFSTLFVEDSHFDYIICLYMFQLGWFNHQPDIYWPKIPIRNVCFSETRDVIHAIHPFNFVILGKFPPVWPGFLTKKVVVNIVKHHVTAVFLRFKISHIDANLQWYLGRWKLPSTEKAFSEAQRKHKRPGR